MTSLLRNFKLWKEKYWKVVMHYIYNNTDVASQYRCTVGKL